jgi:hypothetical protein
VCVSISILMLGILFLNFLWIDIDELEAFLHEHIQDSDGCRLHQVLISILLFADDVVLLASSPKGLQR